MPWIAASALLILALSSSAAQPGPVPAPSSAGFPRFDRVVPLESAIEPSANVAIGDVNGDGHLDVVLAKGRHWPLMNRVFLGDGRGGFPVARELGGKPDRSYSALAYFGQEGDAFSAGLRNSDDASQPSALLDRDGRPRCWVQVLGARRVVR